MSKAKKAWLSINYGGVTEHKYKILYPTDEEMNRVFWELVGNHRASVCEKNAIQDIIQDIEKFESIEEVITTLKYLSADHFSNTNIIFNGSEGIVEEVQQFPLKAIQLFSFKII